MALISLPPFYLVGTAASPEELVEDLDHWRREERCEQISAISAVGNDPATKAWYVAAVKETQYEASNLAQEQQ